VAGVSGVSGGKDERGRADTESLDQRNKETLNQRQYKIKKIKKTKKTFFMSLAHGVVWPWGDIFDPSLELIPIKDEHKN
jgi:hypothetical protein